MGKSKSHRRRQNKKRVQQERIWITTDGNMMGVGGRQDLFSDLSDAELEALFRDAEQLVLDHPDLLDDL